MLLKVYWERRGEREMMGGGAGWRVMVGEWVGLGCRVRKGNV